MGSGSRQLSGLFPSTRDLNQTLFQRHESRPSNGEPKTKRGKAPAVVPTTQAAPFRVWAAAGAATTQIVLKMHFQALKSSMDRNPKGEQPVGSNCTVNGAKVRSKVGRTAPDRVEIKLNNSSVEIFG